MASGIPFDGNPALDELFARHRARLLAIVIRRIDPTLVRRIDPEDVVHESFLRAREKWEWFDTRGRAVMSESSWLYKLTRDCLIEMWRKHSGPARDLRREMAIPDASSMAIFGGLIDSGTRPSQEFAREELRAQVRQAVEMLKTPDREILWMKHLDNLSFQEISEIAQITENAAYQRHFRAVERFMKLWETIHQPSKESKPKP